MSVHSGRPPVDRLREAVAGRVEDRSLRQVAREVGMSASGLQKFLDGATPYSSTRRKIERWYVREAARYGGGLGPDSALAALHVLVQDLAPAERGAALRGMLDALGAAFRAAGREPPDWWRTVAARVERGGEA